MKNLLILFLSINILVKEEYLAIGLICESKEKDYQYFVINKINDEYFQCALICLVILVCMLSPLNARIEVIVSIETFYDS